MGRQKKHRLVTHKCHTCGKIVGRALMSGVWDWRSGNLYTFMYESGGSLMHESATHCNTMLQQTLKCGKKVGFWYSGSGSGHFCQRKGNIHHRVTSDKRRRRWGERTKNTQTYYIHMFIRIYLSAYVCVSLSLPLSLCLSLCHFQIFQTHRMLYSVQEMSIRLSSRDVRSRQEEDPIFGNDCGCFSEE